MPECGLYHLLNNFPKRDVSYLKPIKAECQHLTGYSAVRLQWAPSFLPPGSLNLFLCLTGNRMNAGSLELPVLPLWPQVPQQQRWCCLTSTNTVHAWGYHSVLHILQWESDPWRQIWCPTFAANGWGVQKHQEHRWKYSDAPAPRKWFILRHIIKAWKSLCLSICS